MPRTSERARDMQLSSPTPEESTTLQRKVLLAEYARLHTSASYWRDRALRGELHGFGAEFTTPDPTDEFDLFSVKIEKDGSLTIRAVPRV